jgi:ABC-2 type transport system permease protein
MNKGILVLITKTLALRNSLSRRVVIKRLPVLAVALLFWILLYIGTYKGLSYVRAIEFLGDTLSGRLISMVFFSLMGFLFLSNLITAISSYYLSKDLGFLMASPLGVREILLVKAVETIMDSSWMVLGFIPPVLAAMGAVYGAPSSYYVFIFVLFILFILISSGAGIFAAHLLTWLFPAKRLRDALLLGGLALFVLAYLILQSSVPRDMENPLEMITSFMAFQADSPLLPCYWISEVARSLLKGGDVDMLYPALLFSNSIFFILMSQALGARLYKRNIENVRLGGEMQKRGTPLYPGKGYSILWKDARLFFRDTGQWSQLLIILALAFVYVYNFRAVPLVKAAEYVPMIKEVVVLLNVLMAGLVLAAVSARFTYSSVSLEGRAFWVVRSSPMGMGRFLWSKLLFGLVPVSVLTSGMVVLSNLMIGADTLLMVSSSLTVLVLCASVSGLGAGMGSVWPKFKYENIASVSMSLGGMAFMLAAMGVVMVTVGFVALPYYLYIKAGSPAWPVTAACVLLVLAINLVSFYYPMRAGLRNLEKGQDLSFL